MLLHGDKQARLWGISFIASVLIHLFFIVGFLLLAPELKLQMGQAGDNNTPPREIRVYRSPAPEDEKKMKAEDEQEAQEEEQAQEEKKPQYVKTSEETPEEAPETPDYIGKRNTTISGDEKNKGEVSEEDAPSLDGEDREEINTVEQERQDGPLEFDGKKQSQQGSQQPSPPSPPTPASAPSPAQQVTQPTQSTQVTPPTPVAPPAPAEQALPETTPQQNPATNPSPSPETKPNEQQHEQPNEQPKENSQETEQEPTQEVEEQETPPEQAQEQAEKDSESDKPEEEQEEGKEVEEPRDLEEDPDGAVVLPQQKRNSMQLELPQLPAIPTSTTLPTPPPSTPSLPRPASAHRPTYDPMFTSTAQPGFRTNEKRKRSSGRFVIGRNASLNVAATPLGNYQELIYRRIASHWYGLIDDKAGDILPGSLTIRILINHKGQVPSIQLISRQGASISQQSLTFDAIRRATIPPMPLDVQKEIVGDKLDFTITFYFD